MRDYVVGLGLVLGFFLSRLSATNTVSYTSWEAMAVNRDGTVVYAAEATGAIYISRNYNYTWYQVAGSPLQTNWRSIAVDDTGRRVIAAASSDFVYISSDYGTSWLRATAVTQSADWSVVTSDRSGKYLAAAMKNGLIYTSNNYGAAWNTTDAPFAMWYSMASDRTGRVLTAINYGNANSEIYVSSNWGSSWKKSSAALSTAHTFACDQSCRYLTIATTNGNIYTSNNYGDSINATNIASQTWTALAMDNSGNYVLAAAGSSSASTKSYLYLSTDRGVSWTPASSLKRYWQAVSMSATGQYMQAAVYGGLIHYSQDYGVTWQYQKPTVCAAGTGWDIEEQDCVTCDCTDYNDGTGLYCNSCPADTISSGSACSSPCNFPYYPSTCTDSESASCDWIWMRASTSTQAIIGVAILLLYTINIAIIVYFRDEIYRFSDIKDAGIWTHITLMARILFTTAIPALDILSDILYIITTKFVHVAIFYLCIAAFLHPIVFMVRDLCLPRTAHWLKSTRALMPMGIFSSGRHWLEEIEEEDEDRNEELTGQEMLDLDGEGVQMVSGDEKAQRESSRQMPRRVNFGNLDTEAQVDEYDDSDSDVPLDLRTLQARRSRSMMPHFYLAPIPSFVWNMFEKVDNLGKLLVFSLLSLPFLLINLVWMIPMLVLLFFLYNTKLYAFTFFSHHWQQVWTGEVLKNRKDSILRLLLLPCVTKLPRCWCPKATGHVANTVRSGDSAESSIAVEATVAATSLDSAVSTSVVSAPCVESGTTGSYEVDGSSSLSRENPPPAASGISAPPIAAAADPNTATTAVDVMAVFRPYHHVVVDVHFFQEQSLYATLLESFPLFALQLYNIMALDEITNIALFSLLMSLIAAINITYRFVYYRLLLGKDLKDVPNVLNKLNDSSSSQKSNVSGSLDSASTRSNAVTNGTSSVRSSLTSGSVMMHPRSRTRQNSRSSQRGSYSPSRRDGRRSVSQGGDDGAGNSRRTSQAGGGSSRVHAADNDNADGVEEDDEELTRNLMDTANAISASMEANRRSLPNRKKPGSHTSSPRGGQSDRKQRFLDLEEIVWSRIEAMESSWQQKWTMKAAQDAEEQERQSLLWERVQCDYQRLQERVQLLEGRLASSDLMMEEKNNGDVISSYSVGATSVSNPAHPASSTNLGGHTDQFIVSSSFVDDHEVEGNQPSAIEYHDEGQSVGGSY